MVMSQETWDMVKDKLAEDALGSNDPISYIGRYSGVDIIIDNSIPYNHIEVYERYMYELMKFGRKGDNNVGETN